MTQLERLCALSRKPRRIILGLMSGTSCDGLDMALCSIEGSFTKTKVHLLNFHTEAYAPIYRDRIDAVFCKRIVDLQDLCLLNAWVARYYAELVLNRLLAWGISPSDVDILSSHGQTVYHAPTSLHKNAEMPFNATLQIGDGDHLAALTSILTLSDFRQKYVACGWEGAPLTPYADFLLCTSKNEHRVLINIGGISNVTFLPKSQRFSDMIYADMGPGNTLIDAYIKKHFYPNTFDKDAQIAATGTIHEGLLEHLLSHSFFSRILPKSSGQELFNMDYLTAAQIQSGTQHLSHRDVLRTLVRFSAQSIADFLKNYLPNYDNSLYISGGGLYNPLLISDIRHLTHKNILSTEHIGLHPDAKEALIFAVFANETLYGNPSTSDFPQVAAGKISLP